MRKQTLSMTLVLALLLPGTAGAALIERLSGAAYYDDVLDITWLADANLAATNQFGLTQSGDVGPPAGEVGSTGRMNWATANAWIAGMNAADYLGFDDWRLPVLSPINGVSFNHTFISNNATTDLGYAKTTTDGSDGGWRDGSGTPVSEMGYMYYVNLANLGRCTPDDLDPTSCVTQTGFGLANTGDFVNIQDPYWAGVKIDPQASHSFFFSTGQQFGNSDLNNLFAWAVRSGDVGAAAPVPEPGTVFLLGAALAGLVGVRRRAHRPGASAL